MNIAVIPARGGSKRIHRKNIKFFCGFPVIYWSIKIAQESKLFDYIVVSTDDNEIAKIAKSYGALVPFVRPDNLSDDYMPTAPVVSHAIVELEKLSIKADYVCCIYPCSPMIYSKDLIQAFDSIKTDKFDFIYPVAEYAHPVFRAMKKTKQNKMEFLFPKNELKRTQDTERFFHDSGQFYWGKKQSWLKNKKMHTDGIGFEIPSWRVVDIDTQDDWRRAEILFKCIKE